MTTPRTKVARLAACAIAFHLTAATYAGTETWNFDLITTGNDVFWTSPTAVDNTAPQYGTAYEITLVEVTGTWQIINVGPIDVTDDLDEEDLSGSEVIDGPLPIVLLQDSLVYPEPPEPPSVAADFLIYLDGDGFGQAEVTNVTLGTVMVEIPFFGLQPVQITSIRVVGVIEVTPLAPLCPADLTGDDVVNVFDLLELLAAWGPCPASPAACPADLDENGVVNVFDLLELLAAWGLC